MSTDGTLILYEPDLISEITFFISGLRNPSNLEKMDSELPDLGKITPYPLNIAQIFNKADNNKESRDPLFENLDYVHAARQVHKNTIIVTPDTLAAHNMREAFQQAGMLDIVGLHPPEEKTQQTELAAAIRVFILMTILKNMNREPAPSSSETQPILQ